MRLILLNIVILGFGILGCRAPRQIQQVINKVDTVAVTSVTHPAIDSAAVKNEILKKVHANHIDFNTFLGKVKIDINDGKGKTTNATAFIRIQRDSLIWISLTGPLGIEGFRVLVSKDSVFVMDKLEKTYAARSVNYLQDIIKLPVDFSVLQNLIIGNPVFFADNIISYKQNGGSLMALSADEYFKHMITIDTLNNTVIHSKLDDVDAMRNRTCDITLGGYTPVQTRLFSNTRELTVTEKSKLDILLDFKQVSFDEPQSFPFNVPKNYKLK
ncbi:MAG TPA: DUF4292 domain-containing protein [Phnomibacter sp.]|nr:DUF4292 domain-containing protein [Phnomibacter sp.]